MNTKSKITPYKRFRPAAMIIEGIPLSLMAGGLLFDINELKIIGFMTAAFMYMSASFYLFKAERFKTSDVIIAVCSGIVIAVILVGFLFQMMQWPSGPEMLMISKITLYFALVVTGGLMIFRYLKPEMRAYEFRMSQKLFSRFLIFLIVYYVMGLEQIVPAVAG